MRLRLPGFALWSRPSNNSGGAASQNAADGNLRAFLNSFRFQIIGARLHMLSRAVFVMIAWFSPLACGGSHHQNKLNAEGSAAVNFGPAQSGRSGERS